MGALAGVLAGKLLNSVGGSSSKCRARPYMSLKEIDRYASFLQKSALKKSTTKGYQTGAHDYISFCHTHNLSLRPTPQTLSQYIAYTSNSIASAPKYLTGARHYLKEIYPEFDEARNHLLVLSTIQGLKKVRADPVKRKLPLWLSHLSLFITHSTLTQLYNDLLFATIMSCTFYGCHRMGELIVKSNKTLMDSQKIIKRSSLSPILMLSIAFLITKLIIFTMVLMSFFPTA